VRWLFCFDNNVCLELKLLRDALEQLTSKADEEARFEIDLAREQVLLGFLCF